MSPLGAFRREPQPTLWLGLSAAWCAAGWLVWWLTAAAPKSLDNHAADSADASRLLLLAMSAAGVGLVLRLPILMETQLPLAGRHVLWLLGVAASVHWLGYIILRAPHWSDWASAGLVILLVEVGVVYIAWRDARLPWLISGLKNAARLVRGPSSPGSAERLLDTGAASSAPSDEASEPIEGHITHRQVQGFDAAGRRFASGQVEVELVADQRQATLALPFSPPLGGSVQVDVECDAGEIEVRVVNSTAAGMRLEIRRFRGGPQQVFALQWYAAELELEDPRRGLP